MTDNRNLAATTLTHLIIWDGDKTVDADAIRFEQGVITAIGGSAELSDGARTIGCPGGTAIPGLIDAHVHLVLNPDETRPPAADAVPDPAAMRERAASMVAAGITTARDLGGGHWLELELREDIARGAARGPRLLCSGQPITSPAGHCHFWGGEAADATAAINVLNRQVEHGADLIKIMATGGRMTSGSDPLLAQFDAPTLRRIVEAASDAGLPVAAHCHGTPGIDAAAAAGVSTIEHCSWAGPGGWADNYDAEVAARIAVAGIRVSPTINCGWQRMIGNATGKRVHAALERMLNLGIELIASTDAGIPGVYHRDLPRALGVFAELAGLDCESTLRCATSASADGLGISARTGRLAAGLAADIVVLDGNPLNSLSALTQPIGIWARGEPVLSP
jgi:imidazolonepropionase-like amidohydrolase